MKWEPWYEYKKEFSEDRLPIDEPPCKLCRYWKPHRQYGQLGNYTGVRLCCAEKMYTDFSCYREYTREELDVFVAKARTRDRT